MVQRTLIRPPASRLGPITDAERAALIKHSPVAGLYDETTDRESAYEKLSLRGAENAKAAEQQKADDLAAKQQAAEDKVAARAERSSGRSPGRQSVTETAMKSVVRAVTSSVGRQIGTAIVRGILGSFLRR